MKVFLPIFIVIIGLLMLFSTLYANSQRTQTRTSLTNFTALTTSRLAQVKKSKELRVGYAVYPPYIEKDPQTGEVSGFGIEVVREIASQMNVKPIFIESNWNTFIADLQVDKFDLFPTVFLTIPRAMEIDYSEPFGYFSSVAAIVAKNDNRFKTIADLDRKDVTIAVPQAWTAHEYAKKHFTKANIKALKDDSAALTLADVAAGNSDVALADGPTVSQYIEKNPHQPVKALFLDNPVSIVPASLAMRKGDLIWNDFLDKSLEALLASGELDQLAHRYKLYSYKLARTYLPQ